MARNHASGPGATPGSTSSRSPGPRRRAVRRQAAPPCSAAETSPRRGAGWQGSPKRSRAPSRRPEGQTT
eukprot:2082547-Pyramimonas_sp.AAC.1